MPAFLTRATTIAVATAGLLGLAAPPASAHGTCAVSGLALFEWTRSDSFYVTGNIECSSTHTRYELFICLQRSTLPAPLGSYADMECKHAVYDSTAKTAYYEYFESTIGCGSTPGHWRASVSGKAGTHPWQEYASPGSFQVC